VNPVRAGKPTRIQLVRREAIQRAATACEARDWARAGRIFRRILPARSDDFNALNLMGMIAAQSERGAEAADLLARACTERPDNAAAHYNLEGMLKELGRIEDALASYDRAIALKPWFADAQKNRGDAMLELCGPGNALESCERALSLSLSLSLSLKPSCAAAGAAAPSRVRPCPHHCNRQDCCAW